MKTRIRKNGMVDIYPESGIERITAIRKIIADKRYAKMDGTLIDPYSASCIVAVYDKLSPEEQERYRNLEAEKMALVAFQLMK